MEEPGKRDLHGCGVELGCDGGECVGLERGETAQREEGDVGYSGGGELLDECVVVALDDVVVVLHANDGGEGAGLLDLCCDDVADADMADESLLLEFGEGGDLLLNGTVAWAVALAEEAHVDDVEGIEAEVAEIVVHGRDEFGRGRCRVPGALRAAPAANLGDEGEAGRIGVERFANDLVGDVGAVVVAGVNVIDAGGYGFADDADGFRAVFGRTEDAWTGELHGAIAHAVDGDGGVGECEGAA